MALHAPDMAQAQKSVLEAERILVVPHANADPDCLGSALACFTLFSRLGKEVTVICPETPPENLKFLPDYEKFSLDLEQSQDFIMTISLQEGVEVDKLRYTVEDNKVNIIVVPKNGKIDASNVTLNDGEHKYDLIVVVDTADLSLLGSVYTNHIDLFSSVPILNIDHHISNTGFGQMQMIDATAASATEVLYEWFMQTPEWKPLVTPDMATLLLTGLITDTRSFQNPNTTPRSLEVAAELLEMGARQQEIIENIYKTKPLSTLKIWGRALNSIQVDEEARIVWSAISKEDLAEMEATPKETAGILDELISTVPQGDVHILFTELEEGGLKASLRSAQSVNVSDIAARTFGGGGHPRAAGFRVTQFENFQLQVLECVQKIKSEMKRQGAETRGERGDKMKNSELRMKNEESRGQGQKESKEKRQHHKKEEHVQSNPNPNPKPTPQPNPSVDVASELQQGQGQGGVDVVDSLSGSKSE